MSNIYQDDRTAIHRGDCLSIMAAMAADSVDSIVTDPPYGLGFMGNKWDALPPGKEWAEECLRVLKPGGHLLAFGGSRTWHRLAVAIEDGGFEMRDSIAWMHGEGFPKSKNQLKPAFEPVVVARKPLTGTVAANVLERGTGALNIDGCRIKLHADEDAGKLTARSGGTRGFADQFVGGKARGAPPTDMSRGRWPANVVLDESQAEVLDKQSGYQKDGVHIGRNMDPNADMGGYSGGFKKWTKDSGYGGGGGASRFFYVAKAPKRERPNVDGTAHPTVKPLKLMQWLVRLVTPPGGTVLDPFAGSGTTIEAALIEGFSSIGIEITPEYLPLIQHRIERTQQAAMF